MYDPTRSIIKAFIDTLEGSVKYDQAQYPVYSVVPKEAPNSYVLVDSVTMREDGTKDAFLTECTVLVRVITRYQGVGSKYKLGNLADKVMQIIQPNPSYTLAMSSKFSMVTLSLESSGDIIDFTHLSDRELQQPIRYRMIVEQVQDPDYYIGDYDSDDYDHDEYNF